MDKFDEQKYIDGLIAYTEDTLRFLSNQDKAKRERMVCAAFLRCLGVQFSKEDLISPRDDPPDVKFKEARFEVRELLDEGRTRGREFKERCAILKKERNLSDSSLPNNTPTPISYASLFEAINSALSKKANLYRMRGCASIDALLYINMGSSFLDIATAIPDFTSLILQGWRSVSFVFISYSHVIFANNSAPDFLKKYEGQTRNAWNDQDTLFDLD